MHSREHTFIHTYTWQYILTHTDEYMHTPPHMHSRTTLLLLSTVWHFCCYMGQCFPLSHSTVQIQGSLQSMGVFRPDSLCGPLWFHPPCKSLLSLQAPWWSARSSMTWECWNQLSKGDTEHCSVLPSNHSEDGIQWFSRSCVHVGGELVHVLERQALLRQYSETLLLSGQMNSAHQSSGKYLGY